MPDKRGALDRSMQHHLVNLLFRDGVYERRKTIETLSYAENGDLEPMEVRAVVACAYRRCGVLGRDLSGSPAYQDLPSRLTFVPSSVRSSVGNWWFGVDDVSRPTVRKPPIHAVRRRPFGAPSNFQACRSRLGRALRCSRQAKRRCYGCEVATARSAEGPPPGWMSKARRARSPFWRVCWV
jgi:hypothetical protein